MQRLWSADKLGERRSLAPEHLALLADLPDAGRLGLGGGRQASGTSGHTKLEFGHFWA